MFIAHFLAGILKRHAQDHIRPVCDPGLHFLDRRLAQVMAHQDLDLHLSGRPTLVQTRTLAPTLLLASILNTVSKTWSESSFIRQFQDWGPS